MIYAGGDINASQTSDPPVRGAIRVYLGPVDPSIGPLTYIGEFAVPNAPTWVKIVSVSGNVVTLQRQDGSEVTFNLSTHGFSS